MAERADKNRIRRAFEQAAEGYDAAAVLQREVADRLLERLDYIRLEPRSILDLGAGTGYCAAVLAKRYPKARIVALDIAHAMVQKARARFSFIHRRLRGHGFACGDAERLPFADGSFDLVISSLSLQWCTDLDASFTELRRVLSTDGLLHFATLGPDTLRELRRSWAAVDSGVHVNSFPDMHDVGDALMHARFADPVMDMEKITMTYPEPMALLRDIKGIGAQTVAGPSANHLTGKGRLRAMLAAYEEFRREDGRLPATYEVVYGHGWRVEGGGQVERPDGSVRVSLNQLRGRRHGGER